jgi:hypothetical protein
LTGSSGAGIDEGQARAHAEAMDEALRESAATKSDLVAVRADVAAVRADVAAVRTDLEHKLEIAVREMTTRMGGIAVVLFGALAAIKFFG